MSPERRGGQGHWPSRKLSPPKDLEKWAVSVFNLRLEYPTQVGYFGMDMEGLWQIKLLSRAHVRWPWGYCQPVDARDWYATLEILGEIHTSGGAFRQTIVGVCNIKHVAAKSLV